MFGSLGEIELCDIYLGAIDAKNELLEDSPEQKRRFLHSFVNPPNFVKKQFIERDKYYILGLKGTGKTALLRFIALHLEYRSHMPSNGYKIDYDALLNNIDDYIENKSARNCTSFILFKTDFDEEYRKSFGELGTETIVENNAKDVLLVDYEPVWRWFIYRKIVEICRVKNIQVFQQNHDFLSFESLVTSPLQDKGKSGIMKLIPNLKSGTIEISKDPKLGLEFEWGDSDSITVNFNDLVRRADEKFETLLSGNDELNLFFDELELHFDSDIQHDRDARLIRDLIITIEKINSKAKSMHLPLCLYCGVRSEVQTEVASLGKEINKILKDFGTKILWHRASTSDYEQPLLQVITERLKNSIPVLGSSCSDEYIWTTYFPSKIQGVQPQQYILHHSWYRPRDIVNLLKTAQDQYPHESTFSHNVFDAIRKEYATSSWVEMTEELTSKYQNDHIQGIKRMLYGYKQIFSLSEMKIRAKELAEDYIEVEKLLGMHKVGTILTDLYRIGVVGNVKSGRFRFSFRGDDDVLLEQNFFIHNGLKAYLSVR